jgi:NADH:ubiquinone oxidoreductase subunit 5 (subunit L)/multisubunit Na+/H+ antiporter MnhA subunit
VERLYFVNEIAEDGFVRGLLLGIGRGAAAVDRYVVDGIVNGVGLATRFAGSALRLSITGQLQAYTSLYVLGVVIALGALLVLSGGLLERVAP